MIKNLHLIKVKYHGATDFKGSRVSLTSCRFKTKVTLQYNYKFNNITDVAIDYLKKQGQPIIGKAEGDKEDFIICGSVDNNFINLK